ncbi:solute carrier family 22 member 3-like isoform X1 [Manduca sexta]|uniref:solute carrier family 22 member 3-like isoform X1 n=2 Tax=Manduca sexta TaxID=7130 RepID=UPI001182C466|nr:solute carrier family 22 member 3-like isoform X1 [Manduca sexta]
MNSKTDKQESKKLKPTNGDTDALGMVLHHVGGMGRYQRFLFVAMMPFGLSIAFIYFVQMFIAATPQRHWCIVPELQHLDMELRRNLSAPGAAAGGEWDRCATYQTNWTRVLETMTPPDPSTPTVSCQNGWEFELTDIPYHTVISERGWVCENSGYAPTAQALFFAGSFIGGIFFGWLADNFGRLPALFGANLIGAIGGIATVYTTGLWDFIFCRLLVGMACDNAFMMMYILALEYVGPKHRTWVANMSIGLFVGIGSIILPWLAIWLADWRMLLWVTSMPMLLCVFVPFVIPESVRWLVTRGRVNKAVEVLRKFEKVNGTKIPDDVMEDFIVSSRHTKGENESILTLAKSAPLRTTMALMLIVYICCAVIFDGLVRLSDAFGLDFFITFTLTSATEIPSVTLVAIVLDRWGRRLLTCGPMGISGILILIATFMPKGMAQAGLAIMARFCINMSYNAAMQWATELLPTGVRAFGSSLLHMIGFLATALSPFIVYSERLWTLLPLVILAVLAALGSSIAIILPETKGKQMPQTIEDGEKLVLEHSICGKREPESLEVVEWKSEKEKALIM